MAAYKEPLNHMGRAIGGFGSGVFGQAVFGQILGHTYTKEALTVKITL